MRKIVFMIIIFSCLVIGCGKSNEIKDELASDEVILENIKYKLDQDDSEYGIKYKVAANFRKNVMVNAINYFSETIDDKVYFVMRIYHYTDKDLEQSINWSVENYDKREEVKVGERDYTKVHFVNFDGSDTNLYFYEKGKKEYYVYVFTAKIDLSRLEEIFLNSVVYE